MDTQAETLMTWLLKEAKAYPGTGDQIRGIAAGLGWTYSQVNNAISYVRNESNGASDMIICWKDGRAWLYAAPEKVEDVEEYLRDWRAARISTLLSNVLFLTRKSGVRWGESDTLALMQGHLLAAMNELIGMKTPGAVEQLVRALRPLGDRENGHHT